MYCMLLKPAHGDRFQGIAKLSLFLQKKGGCASFYLLKQGDALSMYVPLLPGVKELESLLIYFFGMQLVQFVAKSQIKKRGIK